MKLSHPASEYYFEKYLCSSISVDFMGFVINLPNAYAKQMEMLLEKQVKEV